MQKNIVYCRKFYYKIGEGTQVCSNINYVFKKEK
jgi:hypothetical protein